MRKLLIGLTLGLAFGAATYTSAQGDISAQVQRLLAASNYWSGLNTFGQTQGVKLERGTLAPAVSTTDRLYNVGGTLYWSGTALGVGSVTSITAGTGISVTGTSSVPIVGLATFGGGAGSCTDCNLTLDAYGRVSVYSDGAGGGGVPSSRTIATTAPLLIDGGASADLSANRTLSIDVSGVTAGTCPSPDDGAHVCAATVNDQGFVTALSTTAISTTAAAHDILSATHSDTVPASVVRGDLMIGNSTPLWTRLAIGSANYVLQSDGTDVSWGNSGAALVSLNATNISSGELADARLSSNVAFYNLQNTQVTGQQNTGTLFTPGAKTEGTNQNWEFSQRTDNSIAMLTVNNPGTNAKGASPSGWTEVHLHAQQEDLDMTGHIQVFPNNYGGTNDNSHHLPVPQGTCPAPYGGINCPAEMVIVSDRNLRFATNITAATLDFWHNDRSALTIGRPGSMDFYFTGGVNAPIVGTSTEDVIVTRGERIVGVNSSGLEAYQFGPTGGEIGGNGTSLYNPPRWPGDANDLLANAWWAQGSLRVAARLGVGCGPATSFIPSGGYPNAAGLCVEPATGSENIGAEIWGPQRSAMSGNAIALRLDTTDTTHTSGSNTALYAGAFNGVGDIGVEIEGTSTGGTDYGLWVNWDDQLAEYLIRVQGSGLDRFMVKNSGAKFGQATNAGGGCGSADNTCGDGTVNFAGDIYRNGTAYTNPSFVLEKYYTGEIEKFAARAKDAGMADYAGLRPLGEVEEFAKTHYDLPLMAENYHAGMFQRGDQLMATVEEAYLYIFQQDKEIKELQKRIGELEQAVRKQQTH